MEILNVIITEDNVVNLVESFCVVDEQLRDDVVEDAVKYFKETIVQLAGTENQTIDDVDEDVVEEGYFEWNDITVQLTWSSCTNTQI